MLSFVLSVLCGLPHSWKLIKDFASLHILFTVRSTVSNQLLYIADICQHCSVCLLYTMHHFSHCCMWNLAFKSFHFQNCQVSTVQVYFTACTGNIALCHTTCYWVMLIGAATATERERVCWHLLTLSMQLQCCWPQAGTCQALHYTLACNVILLSHISISVSAAILASLRHTVTRQACVVSLRALWL
jgi:hypothetical protein